MARPDRLDRAISNNEMNRVMARSGHDGETRYVSLSADWYQANRLNAHAAPPMTAMFAGALALGSRARSSRNTTSRT
jgi:hypothetical protein